MKFQAFQTGLILGYYLILLEPENQSSYAKAISEDSNRTDDTKITEKIRDHLNTNSEIREILSKIQIEIRAGKVTIRGEVNSKALRNEIEEQIASIEGVKQVKNQLKIH